MATVTKAPTSELGQQTPPGLGAVVPWQAFVDEQEKTPELQWPRSPYIYELMLNDAQVEALTRASTLPIRQYNWKLDPNGADEVVVQHVARSLNLPILGEEKRPRGRRKRRFSHDKHLATALRALWYGFYPFEQVGEIVDGRWMLRKLAARPPRTFAGGEIKVAPDGGLEYMQQFGFAGKRLPVNRLAVFVWEQEGANWVGRSMLRSVYRDWLVKDRLIRVNAINHERAGGVPYIEAPEGATQAQIDALGLMARRFKVGENAGGALPPGAKLNLAMPSSSANGNTAVDSIKFHNEEMARAFLAMFMQGGQTGHGSRNMEAEFIDWHSIAQKAIAGWYAEIMNEHVIEDDVDWNFGEEVQAPLLTADELEDTEDADADAAADALVDEINTGNLQVDPEVEAAIRMRSTATRGRSQVRVARKPSPDGAKRRSRPVAEVGSLPALELPDRPLRRQPYDHEVQAQTNFAALDAEYEDAVDSLVSDWQKVRSAQIDELSAAIEAADGDLARLADLAATPSGEDILGGQMRDIAEAGATGAKEEAVAQGVQDAVEPDLGEVKAAADRRATAVSKLLAKSLSEAASRKAISLTGGGALTAADVAKETAEHLSGLSDAYLKDQFGGAVTQAQNSGRRAVMHANGANRIYSSELLDKNTCDACVDVDGKEYKDVVAAEEDYPTGGNKDCKGGPRCRGTLVATYDEAEPTL